MLIVLRVQEFAIDWMKSEQHLGKLTTYAALTTDLFPTNHTFPLLYCAT
jgi:hypothetical protein